MRRLRISPTGYASTCIRPQPLLINPNPSHESLLHPPPQAFLAGDEVFSGLARADTEAPTEATMSWEVEKECERQRRLAALAAVIAQACELHSHTPTQAQTPQSSGRGPTRSPPIRRKLRATVWGNGFLETVIGNWAGTTVAKHHKRTKDDGERT
uniref:Uncharacterized protein n=1 Tax=Mycena chlorophos TaxID=658473 RepID=A0ABQ0LM51_MYCCL|nr:predicted protein [Mycena chlorophos]